MKELSTLSKGRVSGRDEYPAAALMTVRILLLVATFTFLSSLNTLTAQTSDVPSRVSAFASTGKGHPVPRSSTARPSAKDIVFHSFEFQTIYFGREGPNYKTLRSEPSRRAMQLAKAEIFGLPAISSIKFELVDESGATVQLLHFVRTSHVASDGEYFGLVNVPEVPFRVRASGDDIDGNSYERVFSHTFRPREQPPPGPQLPVGVALDSTKVLKSLEAEDERTKASYAKEAEKNPQGVIVIPRIQILSVNYSSFLSANENPIGIRIRYEARFSQDGTYSPSPFVFPVYEDYDLRGSVEMKVLNERIEPSPEVQYSFQQPDLLKYDTPAAYKAGLTYLFTVDLTPDYIIQNAAKKKFCIFVKKFGGAQKMQAVWEALRTNGAPTKYRIEIRNSDFIGETEPFYSQKSFLSSFVKEGAQDCGANPNVNF